jgi:hypothetical protein
VGRCQGNPSGGYCSRPSVQTRKAWPGQVELGCTEIDRYKLYFRIRLKELADTWDAMTLGLLT